MIITEDVFYDTYHPIPNYLDKNASWDGCMFETYGEEFLYVLEILKTEPRRIWTILEAEGEFFISSGFHHVNRFGYLITAIPCIEEGVDVICDEF